MRQLKVLIILGLIAISFIALRCSGSNITVVPDENLDNNSDSIPIIGLSESGNYINGTSFMGPFELYIDPETLEGQLTQKRTTDLGESVLISGLGFFLSSPCSDCIQILNTIPQEDEIMFEIELTHPYEPGNPGEPPSPTNRLDLDIFDPALVIIPKSGNDGMDFDLTNINIQTDVLVDPDGYTTELADLIGSDSAYPFSLAVDDRQFGVPTFNRLQMGGMTFFTTTLAYAGDFDVYLTFGFGFAVEGGDFLNPKYYNPEFNRKPAWAVDVVPPNGELEPAIGNTWDDMDNVTAYPVTVEVWDWQTNAFVWPDPMTYGEAPPESVYSASEVESVSLEIPGLTNGLLIETTPVSGSGMPNDPLIFTFEFANEFFQDANTYPGVVRVTDSRVPPPPANGRDYLIHTPNGTTFRSHVFAIFETYSLFEATIVPGGPGVLFQQSDYVTDGGVDENTAYGCVKVNYESDIQPQYFNLIRDGEWVIQNIPLMTPEGPNTIFQTVIFFDLGVPDGTDVSMENFGYTIGLVPAMDMPMVPNDPYTVFDRLIDVYVDDEPAEILTTVVGGAVEGPPADAGVQHPGTSTNQEAGKNECAPVAVSNSLHYLQQNGWTPPTNPPKTGPCKDLTSIECWYWILGTTSSGTPGDWWKRKERYSDYLGITTRKFSAHSTGAVATEIKGKQAVEANLSGSPLGHTARVTQIVSTGGGNFSVTVEHDTAQGTAGGCIPETFTYHDPSRKITSGNKKLNGRKIEEFIVQCPKT